MKDAYSKYREANVDTADQCKLILIAYDIAIKNCKLALEKFKDKGLIEERTKHLLKVQDAVTELMSALQLDVGPIAENLYKLYDYMLRRLIHANAHSESKPGEEVLGHLLELRDAWNDAITQLKNVQAAPPAQQQPQSIAITG